jgi:hypothetical protein
MFAPTSWKLKALAATFVSAWAGGLATGGAIWGGEDARYVPPSSAEVSSVSPSQRLLDAHDCWTRQAPADMRNKVPGHVVVTKRTGQIVYGGPRLVTRAIDQQLADKPYGLTIWGFCR